MDRLLYIGPSTGTSRQRQMAFERCGYKVDVIDPRSIFPRFILFDAIEWHLSPSLLSYIVYKMIKKALSSISYKHYEFTFVDGGSLISGQTVKLLKHYCKNVVAFNHDDPFGTRDWRRFKVFRRAVSYYDLLVVVRHPNIEESKSYGCRRVMYTYRTADTVAHSNQPLDEATRSTWSSKVLFVGTWMPERGPFLAKLIALGIPLTIYGSGWERAREWDRLRLVWRGGDLQSDNYANAIKSAKICLGLVSKGNRDLHTTRSIEIPMMGAVLCAERTDEHSALYIENEEAVFWATAEECALKCLSLLADQDLLERIGRRGRQRAIANGHTNENLLWKIKSELAKTVVEELNIQ